MKLLKLPEDYQQDVDTASDLLKSEGCKAVYLFGSLVTGRLHKYSDIDIGISGLPERKFFKVYAKLDDRLNKKVDLVDFDENKDFFALLNSLGEVVKIG
ncbi:putative nucleotidyltransferases [Candidatus Termititenax aidoneus]|uniref:Nucleotidyltransferases n=1 Tax=Termititenax aidoneus TaxID=2218524 RepID=A0A388TDB7_TERA1|nr:putative nucleotidyltransferases [Candidatus Termititenax aidoneus]